MGMHANFAKQLDAGSVRVLRIFGSHEERMSRATQAVSELLAEPFDL